MGRVVRPLIVVPTYCADQQSLAITQRCLRTVHECCSHHADIMVCDDGSPLQRDVLRVVRHYGWRNWSASEENQGFSRTVNSGLRLALEHRDACDVILLNADVEISDSGFVRRFYDPGEYRNDEAEAAIQGAVLFFPGDPPLVQHAGVYFSVLRREFDHIHRYAPADLLDLQQWRRCPVTAACMFIRGDALEDVGLFDESFRMGWEDVDYCLRAFQRGYECWVNPTATAVHHESVFRSKPSATRDVWAAMSYRRLWDKHAGLDFSQYVPTMLGVE